MNDRPQYAVECEALGRVYRFSRGLGRGGTQETVALDDLNLTIAPGLGLRPARPERRGQDDDGPHPLDTAHADERDRARAGARRQSRRPPACANASG